MGERGSTFFEGKSTMHLTLTPNPKLDSQRTLSSTLNLKFSKVCKTLPSASLKLRIAVQVDFFFLHALQLVCFFVTFSLSIYGQNFFS